MIRALYFQIPISTCCLLITNYFPFCSFLGIAVICTLFDYTLCHMEATPSAGFSPYLFNQNLATYNYPELPPFGYYQWSPQPITVFGMCSTHLVMFYPFPHP